MCSLGYQRRKTLCNDQLKWASYFFVRFTVQWGTYTCTTMQTMCCVNQLFLPPRHWSWWSHSLQRARLLPHVSYPCQVPGCGHHPGQCTLFRRGHQPGAKDGPHCRRGNCDGCQRGMLRTILCTQLHQIKKRTTSILPHGDITHAITHTVSCYILSLKPRLDFVSDLEVFQSWFCLPKLQRQNLSSGWSNTLVFFRQYITKGLRTRRYQLCNPSHCCLASCSQISTILSYPTIIWFIHIHNSRLH